MTIAGVTDLDTRYVTTYSQKGLDGYLVRVPIYPTGTRKDKRWHTKLFAFRDYPDRHSALLAAAKYRDMWFKEHEHEARLRPLGARFGIKLPSNNKSGIVGVNRTERLTRSRSKEVQWQTTFPGADGNVINRKFSVMRFGEVGALRRAIEARRDGLLDFLTTIDDKDVDVNLHVVGFYDDVLANLRDYADEEEANPIVDIVRDPNIQATTKLDQLLVRVGQQRFRREVLATFSNRCAVTNSTMLIRASHIKPWRVCSNEERLDVNNGLALSPVYDAAFDLGLIAFAPDGRIIVSPRFRSDASLLGITGEERLSRLLEGHQPYLAWHRARVYVANEEP
jgi:hypothetical protein